MEPFDYQMVKLPWVWLFINTLVCMILVTCVSLICCVLSINIPSFHSSFLLDARKKSRLHADLLHDNNQCWEVLPEIDDEAAQEFLHNFVMVPISSLSSVVALSGVFCLATSENLMNVFSLWQVDITPRPRELDSPSKYSNLFAVSHGHAVRFSVLPLQR
ncbi:hypothetical protein Droror1_Dr00010176 [Drosera rotundifolia]